MIFLVASYVFCSLLNHTLNRENHISVLGDTRNSIGMARLAEPVRGVSGEPGKLDIKRNHDFLFIMHHQLSQ